MEIGATCPKFEGLPATDGERYGLADFAGSKLLVLIVSCNHCPYVIAWEERMVKLAREYGPKGAAFVAINPNDTSRYPADDLAHMIERAKQRGFPFVYARDDSQALTRALGARFTPEVFVFDQARALRYHGRIDDNHASEASVKSRDLARALDALIEGKAPPAAETQPIGCSVKWKS